MSYIGNYSIRLTKFGLVKGDAYDKTWYKKSAFHKRFIHDTFTSIHLSITIHAQSTNQS